MVFGHRFQDSGVGRITFNPAGQFTVDYYQSPAYFINDGAYAHGIVTGPDGNLWVSGDIVDPKIAKVGLPGPRVTNLSSTNADGIYGPGSNIAITISLNSIVTVTGNPRLALNSGGIATYLPAAVRKH